MVDLDLALFQRRLRLAALSLVVSAAGALVPAASAQPVPLTIFSQQPTELVATEYDQRRARRLGSGRQQIDLGTARAGSVVRLSWLADPQTSTGAGGQLRIGKTILATLPSNDGRHWNDLRVDIEQVLSLGASVVLETDSDRGLWLSAVEVLDRRSAEPHPRPNVLVFLIDTLRLDHVGVYGYPRPTTPHLDALAGDAVVLEGLIPQSSWTRPSVATLMTSAYPQFHGALDRPDVMRPLPTLAGALVARGWETHGYISNPNLLPEWGFGRQYDRYLDCGSKTWDSGFDLDQLVLGAAIEGLRHTAGRPWFFYVHAMGPHKPYIASAEAWLKVSQAPYAHPEVAQYDADIALVDRHFGTLVEELKRQGVYEDTLIVVLSDHGEELRERGRVQHGRTLFSEVLRIPLIIKLPGNRWAGERRADIVEMVDLAPTLLQILGAPAPAAFQGRSFVELLENGRLSQGRLAYASTFLEGRDQQMTQSDHLKYMQDRKARQSAFFDLAADAPETRPLAVSQAASQASGVAATALQRLALTRAMTGSSGLHIYLQGTLETGQRLTGRVQGTGIRSHSLSTVWRHGMVGQATDEHGAPEVGAIEFEITADGELLTGHADLRLDIEPRAELQVTLSLGDRPFDRSRIHLGRAVRGQVLTATPLAISALQGMPEALRFEVASGPLKAFLWYQAPTRSMTDEQLDPSMLEALEALGYVEDSATP